MAVSLEDKLARLPEDRRGKDDARATELTAEETTLRDLGPQVALVKRLGVRR